MSEPKPVECWLTDMDGVLVHDEHAIPGASEFIERLVALERRFLVLTDNSMYTPRDLRARLARSGIVIPEEVIWTSVLATAAFLASQRPGGSAYVVGEAGPTTAALRGVVYTLTERDPHYVVVGETRTYSFESVTKAIRLIDDGARHQPRPLRTLPERAAHGDRRRGGLITRGHRPRGVRRRQAEPADDARRPEPD